MPSPISRCDLPVPRSPSGAGSSVGTVSRSKSAISLSRGKRASWMRRSRRRASRSSSSALSTSARYARWVSRSRSAASARAAACWLTVGRGHFRSSLGLQVGPVQAVTPTGALREHVLPVRAEAARQITARGRVRAILGPVGAERELGRPPAPSPSASASPGRRTEVRTRADHDHGGGANTLITVGPEPLVIPRRDRMARWCVRSWASAPTAGPLRRATCVRRRRFPPAVVSSADTPDTYPRTLPPAPPAWQDHGSSWPPPPPPRTLP